MAVAFDSVYNAATGTTHWGTWHADPRYRGAQAPRRHLLRRLGGPNFLGAWATETNIVAATTITGDSMCRATNVIYRLDTASARSFLGQFVSLP